MRISTCHKIILGTEATTLQNVGTNVGTKCPVNKPGSPGNFRSLCESKVQRLSLTNKYLIQWEITQNQTNWLVKIKPCYLCRRRTPCRLTRSRFFPPQQNQTSCYLCSSVWSWRRRRSQLCWDILRLSLRMPSRPLSWRRNPRLGMTPLWSFTVLMASTSVRFCLIIR